MSSLCWVAAAVSLSSTRSATHPFSTLASFTSATTRSTWPAGGGTEAGGGVETDGLGVVVVVAGGLVVVAVAEVAVRVVVVVAAGAGGRAADCLSASGGRRANAIDEASS